MRPLRTLADPWLVHYPSFSSTESYSYATATSHIPIDSSRPADSKRPFRTESDHWLSTYLNSRSVSRVLWLQISPYCLLPTLLRVLSVYTTILYIVLFYSLNKTIILSALLVTLVLFVKYPTVTSTKYLPEPMETFPLLLPRKSS